MTTDVTARDAVDIARELGERFAEGAAERDAERRYPDEEVRLLKESGLNALFVPQRYGGFDADYRTAARVFAALGEGDPSLAHIPQAHHCGIEMLKFVGDEALMDKFFPRVAERGDLVTNAYVDKNTKQKIDEFNVPLRREGDGYVLNGEKFYVTGSRWADAFFVPVRADFESGDPELEDAKQAMIWCEADAPGVTIEDDWDGMGQRLTASGTVIFEDTPIEPDCMLGSAVLESTDVPNNYLGSHAQFIFCGIFVGIARAALRDATSYVRSDARPWIHSGVASASEDPYILYQVGGLDIEIEAAEALLDRAADALDRARSSGEPADRDAASAAVARAKVATSDAALHTTHEMFELCGTRSTRSKWHFDRHWRNARTLSLHDPNHYKYKLIGDYVVNGASPPISGWS